MAEDTATMAATPKAKGKKAAARADAAAKKRKIAVFCIFVALVGAILIVWDVVAEAPQWTIYTEMGGVALAIIGGVLYFLESRKS